MHLDESKRRDCDSTALAGFNFPCLVLFNEADAEGSDAADIHTSAATEADKVADIASAPAIPKPMVHPAIVVQVSTESVTLFETSTNTPKVMTQVEFTGRFAGTAFQLALENKPLSDPDGALSDKSAFGFHWFIPELMKHRHVWRDVQIASLVIQLLALATLLSPRSSSSL